VPREPLLQLIGRYLSVTSRSPLQTVLSLVAILLAASGQPAAAVPLRQPFTLLFVPEATDPFFSLWWRLKLSRGSGWQAKSAHLRKLHKRQGIHGALAVVVAWVLPKGRGRDWWGVESEGVFQRSLGRLATLGLWDGISLWVKAFLMLPGPKEEHSWEALPSWRRRQSNLLMLP
jgi:hypothetical protein